MMIKDPSRAVRPAARWTHIDAHQNTVPPPATHLHTLPTTSSTLMTPTTRPLLFFLLIHLSYPPSSIPLLPCLLTHLFCPSFFCFLLPILPLYPHSIFLQEYPSRAPPPSASITLLLPPYFIPSSLSSQSLIPLPFMGRALASLAGPCRCLCSSDVLLLDK